jgi:transposase
MWKRGSKNNEAVGRSRGGLSTKIHMLTDALGRPVRFVITGGQLNAVLRLVTCSKASRDRSCDRRQRLRQRQSSRKDIGTWRSSRRRAKVQPQRAKRDYDRELYKQRKLIERVFNKLKRFWRIAATTGRSCTSALSCIWQLLYCGCDPIVDST